MNKHTIIMQTRCVYRDIRSFWTRDSYRTARTITDDYTGVFGGLFGDAVDGREHPERLVKDTTKPRPGSVTEELETWEGKYVNAVGERGE